MTLHDIAIVSLIATLPILLVSIGYLWRAVVEKKLEKVGSFSFKPCTCPPKTGTIKPKVKKTEELQLSDITAKTTIEEDLSEDLMG